MFLSCCALTPQPRLGGIGLAAGPVALLGSELRGAAAAEAFMLGENVADGGEILLADSARADIWPADVTARRAIHVDPEMLVQSAYLFFLVSNLELGLDSVFSASPRCCFSLPFSCLTSFFTFYFSCAHGRRASSARVPPQPWPAGASSSMAGAC